MGLYIEVNLIIICCHMVSCYRDLTEMACMQVFVILMQNISGRIFFKGRNEYSLYDGCLPIYYIRANMYMYLLLIIKLL